MGVLSISTPNGGHVPAVIWPKMLPRYLDPHLALLFRSRNTTNHYSFFSVASSAAKYCRRMSVKSMEEGTSVEKKKKEDKGWVHFIGIGGCGLSALAMLALHQGFEVSGSDVVWSSFMDGLAKAGARLCIGHSSSNMQRGNELSLPAAVIVSSAIPPENEEILHAKSIGVPIYKRDSWLGKITRQHKLIAISGTHGKSTTASMLAYVLNAMGDDLTAVVGAHVPQFPGGNIISGHGHTFVLEEAMKDIFRRFLRRIRVGGHLILCGDSAGAYSLLNHSKEATMSDNALLIPSSELSNSRCQVTTYGTSTINEWQASSILPNLRGGTDYLLCHKGHPAADISLQIPGVHNVLNSLAVIASVTALINDRTLIYEAINSVRLHLQEFAGVSRRFEMIGKIHGCHIYDDYAHHPTEICAVLQAARQKFPFQDLWVIFQPHTFSRLAAFMKDFAAAFSRADHVIVTEIYAAREINIWNVDGRDLASSIIGPASEYIPRPGDVVDKLFAQILTGNEQEIIVLTLGAGDITTVGRKLLKKLQQRSEKKL